ncbi:MAG TPA: carboxypeptidase-like regulatory domain-containing protein [Longimicrobiales bacterium]|nr:carboxypeptidase-like regulatory domain-containing protein [Longimicrobiales bacterium]
MFTSRTSASTPLRHLPAATALLVLVLAALAAPAPVRAQKAPRRTVVGQVVDRATGRPLAGASVALESLDNDVVTDTAGRFVLRDVPDGTHPLVVDVIGYATGVTAVEVSEAMGVVQVALEPNPVMLKAVTVLADRFRARRNAVPTSVRAFDRGALLASSAPSAADFVQERAMLMRASCGGWGGGRSGFALTAFPTSGALGCVYVRGRPTSPVVYIDERPAFGLDELAMYRPDELFLVEVYGAGAHIRAYTTWFVERSAKVGLAPIPIF